MRNQLHPRSDFVEYVILLHRLHAAMREGGGESAEADEIRDRMDEPGSRLSPDEITIVQGISADFYSITDPVLTAILPRTAEVKDDLAEVTRARANRDFPRALDVLRRRAAHLEPSVLAFQRGRIWLAAEQPAIAAVFLERAAELQPANPNYRSIALHVLATADPPRARERAGEILRNSEDQPARLVLIACQILYFEARECSDESTRSNLESVVTAIRGAMERMMISGEDQTLPGLFLQAFALLGLCFELLGDPVEARNCYDEGLRFGPDDPSLLVVRGIQRYGEDSPGAVADFERAIRRGSDSVWPYYFLAHHHLLSRSFQECLRTSTEGLQREATDSVRADLQEWIAISSASLGDPRPVVEAWFQQALRLAPDHRRIRANYELYVQSQASEPDWDTPTSTEVGRSGRQGFKVNVQNAA